MPQEMETPLDRLMKQIAASNGLTLDELYDRNYVAYSRDELKGEVATLARMGLVEIVEVIRQRPTDKKLPWVKAGT